MTPTLSQGQAEPTPLTEDPNGAILRELIEASDAYEAALPTRNWTLHDPVAAKAEQARIDAASARKRAAWDSARSAAAQLPAVDNPPSEEVEELVACLGDDAAQLREDNPEDERAATMDAAAAMLERLDRANRNLFEQGCKMYAAAQLAAVAVPPAVSMPLEDAQMLLSWMDETFGNDGGDDWFDADAAAVGDALGGAIENFKRMRAAVAAPEARIPLTDAQIDAVVEVMFPKDNHWHEAWMEDIARPIARAIEAALRHPAAPGSSTPSAAPLSEPCALDQGARPVRLPLGTARLMAFADSLPRHPWGIGSRPSDAVAFARLVEAAHGVGIAPPVDQQEGSTR